MNSKPVEVQTLVLEQMLTAAAPSPAPSLVRGLVADILENGEIEVVIPPDAPTRLVCDFLETGAELELHPGDLVLVMPPAGVGQNGCILGRVGRYRPSQENPPPARVVIEASEVLTLKCGESSVDLRNDGKLMIRGNDVLTRAKRTNRIKGGSVAIN
jgi:hypothetical protein